MNAEPLPRPVPHAVRQAGSVRRDRYRLAVVAVTGVAAAGSLTATGWLVGQAAQTWSAQQPAADTGSGHANARPAASHHRRTAERDDERVVLRPRPARTRVTLRYVRPAAPVGGGSVSSTPTRTTNPAPAPSSGS